MNKICLWFYLSCKRQLKHPFFLFLLCLLPLGAWMFHRTEDKSSGKISIALLTEGDSWNGQLAENLIDGGHSFEFYLCEDREALEAEVMTGDAECGFIFRKDLKKRLDSGNYKRAVVMVTSPSTVAASLASETVFSGLFEVYGRELLKEYTETGEIFDNQDAADVFEEMEPLYNGYLENGSTFSFTYETADGGIIKKDSVAAVFPVKGILAVFLFVIGLSAAVRTGEDEKRGLFITLPAQTRFWCRISGIAAPVLIAWCFAYLSILLSGGNCEYGWEAVNLAIYAILVILVSWLLLKLVRDPLILAGLIPFFVIVSLIACPVFADLSAFVPAIKNVRWFLPPYYYLIM